MKIIFTLNNDFVSRKSQNVRRDHGSYLGSQIAHPMSRVQRKLSVIPAYHIIDITY